MLPEKVSFAVETAIVRWSHGTIVNAPSPPPAPHAFVMPGSSPE